MEAQRPCLQELPTEVLVSIFSYLDVQDFKALEQASGRFHRIINDEELWKNMFLARMHTKYFPSCSRSSRYSIEYGERNLQLARWRHSRAITTKYEITHERRTNDISAPGIRQVVFDFPRCACYNEGLVTFLQLNAKRRKDRLVYIQCATPHSCSVMHFNINAVVFGRFDGKVFGKLLTNKSYLSPVIEFDSSHNSCVTAITTIAYEGSSHDWCVSGSEDGEIIWWCDAKLHSRMKISNQTILKLFINPRMTVAIDTERAYIITGMKEVHSLELANYVTATNGGGPKFIQVDFGGELLVLGSSSKLCVVSINRHRDIGFSRKFDSATEILQISIDENTARREAEGAAVAGGDGCYIAVRCADYSVMVFNIRSQTPEIKPQLKLSFHEPLFSCKVNHLILACAFSGMVGLYDAAIGTEVRVTRGTEEYPQFLDLADGHLVIGSGNTLHYHQYASLNQKKKKKPVSNVRGNRWNETVQSQLEVFHDTERLRNEQVERDAELRQRFLGDVDDEEIQLQIALVESETTYTSLPAAGVSYEEEFRRALEESRRAYEASQGVPSSTLAEYASSSFERSESGFERITWTAADQNSLHNLHSPNTGPSSTSGVVVSNMGTNGPDNSPSQIDSDLELAMLLSLHDR
ncbi:AFR438Wp [Eremothecium gossypii ATCC 10895]|uniref:AFR438Wp n=1 Tax=Eremothecium gossypii (strain ATCC 10895 / CBS 109.51 / FGSC 9923 / NRRL Y-1056) TaxID=284811 RepID=Q752Y5_EREGS|nr:AFR438Wp [Eremothecium gossypii ATCC 10895]AAS53809.1 AFR438Wp [Eremothecium gossypii ATCC 10895]